jgi:hypothetical protein
MGAGLAAVAAACGRLDVDFPIVTGRTDSPKLISHTSLFDFDRTAAGAEWIDAYAEQAHAVLWSFPPDAEIVTHGDWRLGNVEVAGGALRAVYDWSSLQRRGEAEAVGTAAVGYGAWWDNDGRKAATPGEAAAFLSAYERASGTGFSDQQRRIAGAAAVAHLAFVARCEHSMGWGEHPDLCGSALREYGDELLRDGVTYR